MRRPRVWLAGILLATAALGAAIPSLELRTDGNALYPDGDAVVRQARLEAQRFHEPETVVLLLVAREDTTAFTPRGLATLRTLTARVQTVRGVRAEEVLSLATALDITASAQGLRIVPWLESVPQTAAACTELRARLQRAGIYEGALFGRDALSFAVQVPLAADARRSTALRDLRQASAGLPGFDVLVTGPVAVEVLLGEHLLADLARLVPFVVGVVGVLLFVCFRSAAGVLVPLLEVVCVLVWTLGGMALAGIPLSLVTAVLPVLLMTLGMTDEIHLLERVVAESKSRPRPAAILEAVRQVGRPIVRTSLTTALGFLSFLSASVAPMRHFGGMAAAGIVLAMGFTLTLVPAALVLAPASWWRSAPSEDVVWRGRFESWAVRRSGSAAGLALVLLLAASAGMTRLHVQDSWVQNFDPASDVASADALFEAQYWGTYRLDVILEARSDDFFTRPDGIALLDSVQSRLANLPGVGGTLSLLDYQALALAAIDPARRLGELDARGLAQLHLLLEAAGMMDELVHVVSDDGRRVRLQCWVANADYTRGRELLARAERAADAGLPAGVDARVTGDLAVATRVVHATVANQLRSVLLTLVGLVLLLSVSVRSLRTALVTLAPVLATIWIVFGSMGFAGVPLGIATSMFAALTLGVGVDFGIHFVSRYLDLRPQVDEETAMSATIASAGRAIRWNAIVLGLGFAVLTLSRLRPDRALGGLLAAGIGLGYVLAACMLPWLLRRLPVPRHRAWLGLALGLVGLFASTARGSDDAAGFMHRVEVHQRSGQRLFTMHVDIVHPSGHTQWRRIVGVSRNDPGRTRILYVITDPDEFSGSTLLIHDAVDTTAADRCWTYFPGLEAFREVQTTSLRLLVPGTGLTYEDARGWIANEKYVHRSLVRDSVEVTIESTPATPELARQVGASRLLVRLDPRRDVVTGVAFHDLAGNIVRTYEATAFVHVGDVWLPEQVRTAHRTQLLDATIHYRYRPLEAPPPEALFAPAVEPEPFLERLQAWLASCDLGFDGPGWMGVLSPER